MIAKEKKRRSVIKALTWRFLATMTTMSLVYIFTGNAEMSLTVGVFDVIIKLVVYYFHERAWNRVGWGLAKNK